mgnify:CR=1 FL=1
MAESLAENTPFRGFRQYLAVYRGWRKVKSLRVRKEPEMLVLTRKLNEALVIVNPWTGDRIRLVVTAIHRGRVQLGVEAPPSVHVWREDLMPGGAHWEERVSVVD